MTERGASASDNIRIGFYEDWMLPQIVDLFAREYGVDREREEQSFLQFYEHAFQREHGLRIVAIDGERVCGFQSFFYWPYVFEGRTLKTFQSGRSLVSPDYRGKRIFARLLNHLGELEERPAVDFLIGFPVEMSYGSFLRNDWSDPLRLSWHARVIRPLSVLRDTEPSDADFHFEREAEPIAHVHPEGCFSLSKEADFLEWRRAFQVHRDGGRYYYFHHRRAGKSIRFELKPNRRGRINELILGDIAMDDRDPALLRDGLGALVRAVRQHRFVSILTIALNRHCRDATLLDAVRRRLFVRLRPEIYFIAKQVDPFPQCEEAANWLLLRGDIDTW